MIKKLLVFLVLIMPLFLKAQCGPSYSDNANFDSAGNSVGISFTTDSSCEGTLTSITINSGFSAASTSLATVRLYEGDGLGGNILGTLSNVDVTSNNTFNFSTLMISISASSQYTIIISDFTQPALTGRGFNGPFFPAYTGGVLYKDGVAQSGEHLAFLVNIDTSTLSVDAIDINKTRLLVYPNPAKNSIQITALPEKENFSIFDIYGRKVLEGSTQQNEITSINIQKLTTGTYFILLNKKVLKFVKE